MVHNAQREREWMKRVVGIVGMCAKRNKNLKTDDNVTRERSVSSRYRSEREDAVKT